jgi:hypothetical protein
VNWTMHQVLYSSLFANRRVMSVRSWTHRSGITSDSDSMLLPPPSGTAIFAQTSRTSVSDTFPPVAATFCASALATPTDILQSFRYCAGESKTSQPPRRSSLLCAEISCSAASGDTHAISCSAASGDTHQVPACDVYVNVTPNGVGKLVHARRFGSARRHKRC